MLFAWFAVSLRSMGRRGGRSSTGIDLAVLCAESRARRLEEILVCGAAKHIDGGDDIMQSRAPAPGVNNVMAENLIAVENLAAGSNDPTTRFLSGLLGLRGRFPFRG